MDYRSHLKWYLFSLIVIPILSGCKPFNDPDHVIMSRKDLNTLMSPPAIVSPKPKRHQKQKRQSEDVHPSLRKSVSVTITEALPLKEILVETAHQIGVNLQLDPQVQTRLNYSAHGQPFIDILKQICQISNLRYTLHGQSVRIELDTPYAKSYNIQFLNLSRVSENKVSIATDVFSSLKSSTIGDNGSSSSVVGKGNSDFWGELEASLKILLGTGATFSIHRQGGIITLKGTSHHHKLVKSYLKKLQRSVSTQVLIEAKIVEVTLKDEYKAGINWEKMMGGALKVGMPLGNLAQRARFADPTSAQGDVMSLGVSAHDFSILLKAIEEFGAARTLSNPRLTVMNNQTAVMKVAQNQVYFRLNYDKQYNMAINRESFNVSSEIQTVPIGLVMSVQPSIDPDSGEIILSLRPTVSRLSQSVNDPAVDIAFNASQRGENIPIVQPKPSLIPVVEVREMDTVLRVASEKVVVMGGFMEVRSTDGVAKLPGAGDIPVMGELFKATSTRDEIIELVVLLKVTIIDDGSDPDEADRRLLKEYTDDSRPFDLNT